MTFKPSKAITAAGCSAWKSYLDAPDGRNWHEGMADVYVAMMRAAQAEAYDPPRCMRCQAVWERGVFDVCPVCIRPAPKDGASAPAKPLGGNNKSNSGKDG